MISFVVEMKDNKICRGIFLVEEKEDDTLNEKKDTTVFLDIKIKKKSTKRIWINF